NVYTKVGTEFASHGTVNHQAYEWARGVIHTNTVEGFFSIFKRGMKGVYQHCGEQHLHRYFSEFDFRYSYRVKLGYGDVDRTLLAMKGIEGKRLTYRRTFESAKPVSSWRENFSTNERNRLKPSLCVSFGVAQPEF